MSNIGIAINKHICYTEGIIEYTLMHSNHCEDHEQNSSTSCCKKPFSNSIKKDCCEESVVYAVLDTDVQLVEKTNTLFSYISSHYIFNNYSVGFPAYFQAKEFSPPLLVIHNSINQSLSSIGVFRI